MDGNVAAGMRKVLRDFEANRLEEEIWALAYEVIWPVARRSLRAWREIPPDEIPGSETISQEVARSA